MSHSFPATFTIYVVAAGPWRHRFPVSPCSEPQLRGSDMVNPSAGPGSD